MSHHTEEFAAVPTSFVFNVEEQERLENSVELLIKGQGVFVFSIAGEEIAGGEDFTLSLLTGEKNEITLTVTKEEVTILDRESGESSRKEMSGFRDLSCQHWFSLDAANATFRYGEGEVREKTTILSLQLGKGEGEYQRLSAIDQISYTDSITPKELLRDPVVTDPPLKVVPTSQITIEDVARGQAIVPANLTPECQQLYYNIAGENFRLETSDFPEFVDAVEQSINDREGWCYRKLREKASEFGEENLEETYLRITVGQSQGESPGIPYVIEIWPPGHYSPIHSHANTNAIIRVLSGEITVSLYPSLSKYNEKPFTTAKLRKGEVTWISPRFNQIHQLQNTNVGGPVCITIQCYMYGAGDNQHYNYFDYLDDRGEVHQFLPNSDAEFLEFKQIIAEEWQVRKDRGVVSH